VTKSDDAEALDAEALDAEALDADVGRFETEERGGMVSLEKRAERKTSRCSENSGVHDHALFIHREHSSRVTRNEFDRFVRHDDRRRRRRREWGALRPIRSDANFKFRRSDVSRDTHRHAAGTGVVVASRSESVNA